MATYTQKIEAEHKIRELIEREGLPMPDRIEYGYTCIRLLWFEPKLALVIDIDEPPEPPVGEPDGRELNPIRGED